MRFSFARFAFPGWRYALLALAVLAVGGYFYFGRAANPGATITVAAGDFKKQISVSGTVTAAQNADLGFAANGRIARISARVGDYVSAGALLAQVENGDLAAAVAQKQAALASLLAGTRPEELAIATAAVASDRAKLVNAINTAYTVADDAVHNKTDVFFTNPRTTQPKLSFMVSNTTLKSTVEDDRATVEPVFADWAALLQIVTPDTAADAAQGIAGYLAKVNALLADANAALNQAVPDQTNTTATLTSYATALATARANVNAAITALTDAVATLTDAQKTLVLDQAGSTASNIAAARADVENATAALAKTYVVAPFSGVVTRMDAKTGEIVSPSTSLISMQSDGIFQIETYVPEVTIAGVATGDPATTTLDAYGSARAFPVAVIAVDPAETVKDGVPTYKTTLSFLKTDPAIRSGMTANVVIETGVLHNAIVIPAGAVGTKNNAPYVSVLDHGVAADRAVTTGSPPALGQMEILSGLSSGDIILLTPVP